MKAATKKSACSAGAIAPVAAPMTVERASAIFLAFAMPCIAIALKSYFTDVRIADWPREVSGYPAFRDFANLWIGGIAGWTADFPTLFNRAAHGEHFVALLGVRETHPMWSYPPTAILLMMPFGLLSYAWACAAWSVTGVLAYLAASGVFVGDNRTARWQRLGAIVLSPGVFLCLTYGQTAFLTSAALVTGMFWAPRRPVIAGALLALLAIKPQLALVVPFALLAMGAWRAFIAAGAFAALFCALTVAVFGVEPWQDFVAITLPQQFMLLTAPQPSDQLDVTLIISVFEMLKRLGMPAYLAYSAQTAFSVAVLGGLVVAVRRELDGNLRVLMIACAALLVSPYALTYELPLLVLAVARIFASPETLSRLSEREVTTLAASATVAPFVALTMLTYSQVNFVPLIPLFLLITFGMRWPVSSRPAAYRDQMSITT